jgi:ubiquinone/menaquinone biosynthesis C-methylase UbiE
VEETMMHTINWATPLYKFLRFCNQSELEKVVLDCGAGGDQPPLEMFFDCGYQTFGIELAPDPLTDVRGFCKERGKDLNIIQGDMRHIPIGDEQVSFVYSYNAIFFMTKEDIQQALKEMERVLRVGGLCFVNLLSVDEHKWNKDEYSEKGLAMFGSAYFAYHEDNEADDFFSNFEILHKEKRILERLLKNGEILKQAYLDYIVRKRVN